MAFECFVEVFLVIYPKRNHKFNVVVALTKFKIALVDGCFVRRNENLYRVALYFVAKVVGFFFVKRNNEVAKTISSVVKGLFRLKEGNGWWRFTTKN
ncbi:MAG: hypothetical protein B7Z14_14100 [Bosea sp. 32-68-6]|nr:MAG: hypothetical protein B7Z14_14100 [Bosea sp. 32-68-6]